MSTKELMFSDTFYLMDLPSFVGGLSSVLDIGSTLTVYNESPDADTADERALQRDWAAVGKDIKKALDVWASRKG